MKPVPTYLITCRTEEEALLATGESPTVTIVQVLLLLGIKTLRTSQRHKSWNFFGLVRSPALLS